jgi:hypothetical protein
MINDITLLRMPFKRGIIFREKPVPFLFKIMTLEMTCDHLGVEFGDLFSKENAEVDIFQSLIWNGYLAACMYQHRRPKYDEVKSHFWAEYMSAETRKLLVAEVTKLMTYLKEGIKTKPDEGEDEKKK